MVTFKSAARRIIHGRRVESGKYPLYRMLALVTFIAALLQLIYNKVPETVANQTPHYFDTVYIMFQLGGSTAILLSLYVPSRRVSARDVLSLERVGCILSAGAALIYFITVIYNNAGPPLSSGVWLVAGWGLYCVYRVWEITRGSLAIAAVSARQARLSGDDKAEVDG